VDAFGNGTVKPVLEPQPVPSSTAATLVGACAPPVGGSTGLTFDGSCLWLVDFYARRAVRLDPNTCAVVASIPLPVSYPAGLEWDGSAIWCADADANRIYRLNPSNGAILSSFLSHSPCPFGVTFTGDVWTAATGCEEIFCGPDVIDRQSTAGVHLHTFTPPGAFPTGLAFDGVNIWHSDNSTRTIYKLNPTTGAVLDSFPAPGPYPNDLAWDGRYLWVAENIAPPVLYKYDVGRPTPTRKTSWGGVKAFYR
jgi:streptogramin lyase